MHGLASRFHHLSRSPAPIQSTQTPSLQTVPYLRHIQPVTLTRPGGAAGPHSILLSALMDGLGGVGGGVHLCASLMKVESSSLGPESQLRMSV